MNRYAFADRFVTFPAFSTGWKHRREPPSDVILAYSRLDGSKMYANVLYAVNLLVPRPLLVPKMGMAAAGSMLCDGMV